MALQTTRAGLRPTAEALLRKAVEGAIVPFFPQYVGHVRDVQLDARYDYSTDEDVVYVRVRLTKPNTR